MGESVKMFVYSLTYFFPFILLTEINCIEKQRKFGIKQKNWYFWQANNIREATNRWYQLQSLFLDIFFSYAGTQLINSKIFKWNISRFLLHSQRRFDHKTGNMTDENDGEKRKNVSVASVCFRKNTQRGEAERKE
jgi:hypothetical protein